MSDNTVPAQAPAAPSSDQSVAPITTAAPVAVAAPLPAAPVVVPAVVAPAAAVATPATTAPVDDSERVNRIVHGRLERARKSQLKDLGVESEDELKTALAAHRAKLEADKTAETKIAELTQNLAAEREKSTRGLATIKGTVDAELARVTPEQRAVVERLAGSDPAAQLDTLRALAPTWQQATPVPQAAPAAIPIVQPAVAAAPAAPVPMTVRMPDGSLMQVMPYAPPAAPAPIASAPAPTATQTIPPSAISTAPATGNGPPAQAAPAQTVTAKYEALKKSHPTAGALFMVANAQAIEREKQLSK